MGPGNLTAGHRFALFFGALLFLPGVLAAHRPASSNRPSFDIVGLSFEAIQVPDVVEAAASYGSVLGLEEVNSIDADYGSYSIKILAGSELNIELIHRRNAVVLPAGPHLGFFKAGVFVADIDEAFAFLRERNAATDGSIMINDALRARTFVFRDPYGNRLQVFQQCAVDCRTR